MRQVLIQYVCDKCGISNILNVAVGDLNFVSTESLNDADYIARSLGWKIDIIGELCSVCDRGEEFDGG